MLAAAHKNDWLELNRIDRTFHDQIIQLSGHSLLESTWSTVQMRVQQVLAIRNMRNRDIVMVAKNHLPILDALEKHDLEQALAAIQEHVASSGDLIAEGWHDGDALEEPS